MPIEHLNREFRGAFRSLPHKYFFTSQRLAMPTQRLTLKLIRISILRLVKIHDLENIFFSLKRWMLSWAYLQPESLRYTEHIQAGETRSKLSFWCHLSGCQIFCGYMIWIFVGRKGLLLVFAWLFSEYQTQLIRKSWLQESFTSWTGHCTKSATQFATWCRRASERDWSFSFSISFFAEPFYRCLVHIDGFMKLIEIRTNWSL